MKRFDFEEEDWSRYSDMMKWLIKHYGVSEYWKWSWFEPRRPLEDAQWFIGTHRIKWYSRRQRICVWMTDEAYTFFMLRWS
jgi:hypothetical protein